MTTETEAARKRALWLLLAVALSLALSMTPWGKYVLYPFKLFTTWVHESGHALAAILVGGDVVSMSIEPNTEGLTRSRLPSSILARAVVSSAGYMGASIFGCILLAATRLHRFSHAIIYALGVAMLLSVVIWMRNLFGIGVVILLGGALVLMGRHVRGPVSHFILTFLGVQVALNALFDIRVLFHLEEGTHSDAANMEKLLLISETFWAGLWMLASVLMVVATLWLTREKELPSERSRPRPRLAPSEN
ncbi:MAG: M50 family metallopeptidase [Myxococcota bacterium]